jgi:sigma-B regulation protein RsbU (phosphoserine phosphatase)
MNGHTLSVGLRYGSAVAAVVAATLLCLLLDPILEGHLYYLWFLLALLFTAWYGGFRPSALAFLLSLPLIDYFFAPPRFAFGIEGLPSQVGFLTFCFVALAVLWYSSVSAERARKIAEAAERVVREQRQQRRTATAVQQGLLPRAVPRVAGFEIVGRAVFAEDVGGDCFDFIPSAAEGEPGVTVVIADASGHGMASALLVSETRATIRALALTGCDVGPMLNLANRRLARDGLSDYFVTLLLARLDARRRSLVYANAGHCPGYVLDGKGHRRTVLRSSAVPLGIDEATDFPTSEEVCLQAGELVVLFTDGIVEAASPEGQHFGAERMLDLVRTHRDEPLDVVLGSLFGAVTDFTHRPTQEDDMTVVLVRATPP